MDTKTEQSLIDRYPFLKDHPCRKPVPDHAHWVEWDDNIRIAALEHRWAEQRLWKFVQNAHADRIPWTRIGSLLGVSRQAARQRFSKPPRGHLL